MQGILRRREEEWLRLSTHWQFGMSAIQQEWQEVEQECGRWFPPWIEECWPPELARRWLTIWASPPLLPKRDRRRSR